MAEAARNGRREQRPSFQFYPQDFLASDSVAQMTHEEVGIYMLLLCRAWVGPGLPTDLARVARLVGLPEGRLRELWSGPLGSCFVERDGRLVNPRQEREREVAQERTARRAQAGSRGGNAASASRRGGSNATTDEQQCCDASAPLLEQSDSKGDGTGRDGMGWVSGSGGEPERGAPVPEGTSLAEALRATLPPPPPEVVAIAREWDEHTRENGHTLTRRAWMTQFAAAAKDPAKWVAKVRENLDKNTNRLQDPPRGPAGAPNGVRLTAHEQANQRRHAEIGAITDFLLTQFPDSKTPALIEGTKR